MIPEGLLIIGFGGHARSVADVALDVGVSRLAFVDPNAKPGEELAGFRAETEPPSLLPEGWCAFPAAGDGSARQQQFNDAVARGYPLCALVSRRAYVGHGAVVGDSSLVAHSAHLGPFARIGQGAIINTGAVVDHESEIGAFTHISVNATVAGRCKIGRHVMIGAGAVIVDRVRIADDVVVGAGCTVVDDILEPGTYVGTPARRLR